MNNYFPTFYETWSFKLLRVKKHTVVQCEPQLRYTLQ
jgi:hypothetical protein